MTNPCAKVIRHAPKRHYKRQHGRAKKRRVIQWRSQGREHGERSPPRNVFSWGTWGTFLVIYMPILLDFASRNTEFSKNSAFGRVHYKYSSFDSLNTNFLKDVPLLHVLDTDMTLKILIFLKMFPFYTISTYTYDDNQSIIHQRF